MNHTSKESLHEETKNFSCRAVPKNKSTDVDDALSVDEEFNFAVGFAFVVQPDSLGDNCPATGFEVERSTADGGAVGRVARGEGCDITYGVIGVVVRGQIRIQLSCNESSTCGHSWMINYLPAPSSLNIRRTDMHASERRPPEQETAASSLSPPSRSKVLSAGQSNGYGRAHIYRATFHLC